jgi:polysaccharide biosynthesis protein PslH
MAEPAEGDRPIVRVAWIGTRPPAPPVDGGRLVALTTIRALADAGADITVIAPGAPGADPHAIAGVTALFTEDRPASWTSALARGARSGRPATIERHAAPRVRTVVGDLLTRAPFDVVHVEQPHALAGAAAARARGVVCIVRTHNVESEVWDDAASDRRWPVRSLLKLEARRLRRFEASVFPAVDAVIALSRRDAVRLRAIAPDASIHVVPPPAPVMPFDGLPAPGRAGLEGEPALVWIGSRGWPPNDAAMDWLITGIWPAIGARLPNARLHAFGAAPAAGPGVIVHETPADSADAFQPHATLLLPLRRAAGVRMRVLEAWGSAVPVIASRAALEGLETADGENVLVADDPAAFAHAAERLLESPDLRARLIDGGRQMLRRRHDPGDVARLMLDVYREAMASRSRARACS